MRTASLAACAGALLALGCATLRRAEAPDARAGQAGAARAEGDAASSAGRDGAALAAQDRPSQPASPSGALPPELAARPAAQPASAHAERDEAQAASAAALPSSLPLAGAPPPGGSGAPDDLPALARGLLPRIGAAWDAAPAGADPAAPAPAPVALGELRAHPSRHLGERVRFVLQFQACAQDWSPCLSRFGPEEWIAAQGWPDEAFVWEERVFADPAARLFARRGTPLARRLLATRPYERVALVGVVREVFGDEPWVELESLEPLVEEVGEGTVVAVGRALELLDAGQFELARSQLERAQSAPLPAHARAEIERLLGECDDARERTAALRRALR